MCGITGAVWTHPSRAIDRSVLEKMTESLRHRGPDEDGYHSCGYRDRPPYQAVPGVALGHRRLSIIDVDSGSQPMSNEDDTVWIVFNGEIYNHASLRNRLHGAGHQFRTECDTEVIVHLYEDEGTDCFRYLNGMFAIAIWDSNRRRLVLARDRVGQKPLVYAVDSDRLLFASELKALTKVPGRSWDLDLSAADEYLTYQYIPHPNTIYRDVRKLPPAHFAVYQDGRLDIQSYWSPPLCEEPATPDLDYQERLQELLRDSVRLRLQSEVPLGAFLSGGMDSSVIVALMTQLAQGSVKTFSIGFSAADYDETHYARRVARHLETEHEEFRVEPDCMEVLPQLIRQFDEPFADSSAVPTWYLSEMTRRHVTVALTGDGGDELFAGYQRYRAADWGGWIDLLPRALRRLLAGPLWQRLPGQRQKSIVRRAKRFLASVAEPPARRYIDWIAIFNESRRAELYTDQFLEQLPPSDPVDFVAQAWRTASGRGDIVAASATDLMTYLPCDLMTKVDMASMAHGLECRQPMLDHRVIELCMSMPIGLKYRRGRGKRILWETFGDLLPAEIGHRPKMGFGVPLADWLRHQLQPMLRDTLLDRTATDRGMFNRESVERLIDEHVNGRFDHGYRLWSLLVFELWMRQWLDA